MNEFMKHRKEMDSIYEYIDNNQDYLRDYIANDRGLPGEMLPGNSIIPPNMNVEQEYEYYCGVLNQLFEYKYGTVLKGKYSNGLYIEPGKLDRLINPIPNPAVVHGEETAMEWYIYKHSAKVHLCLNEYGQFPDDFPYPHSLNVYGHNNVFYTAYAQLNEIGRDLNRKNSFLDSDQHDYLSDCVNRRNNRDCEQLEEYIQNNNKLPEDFPIRWGQDPKKCYVSVCYQLGLITEAEYSARNCSYDSKCVAIEAAIEQGDKEVSLLEPSKKQKEALVKEMDDYIDQHENELRVYIRENRELPGDFVIPDFMPVDIAYRYTYERLATLELQKKAPSAADVRASVRAARKNTVNENRNMALRHQHRPSRSI